MNCNVFLRAGLLAACGVSVSVHADDVIDELVISTPLSTTQLQANVPVDVLDQEALRQFGSATIGETVSNIPGVHSASFGPGVGQPVIRGLSGNRVAVLQNGIASIDVSGVSQDHASSVEPLLAQRVEVLRGPSTLLYGNGAIGGVVNVIDNRTPRALGDFSGAFQIQGSTVNDAVTNTLSLDGSLGQFAWHVDGSSRSSDDATIPGRAIDERTGLISDRRNRLLNSSSEADEYGFGGSWIFENGFIGLSASKLDNRYGIPVAPGREEEEEEQGGEEEEGPELIDIDLEQKRVNLWGEFNLSGAIKKVGGQLLSSRYNHTELEGAEEGTQFRSRGYEARGFVEFRHAGNARGVIGTQILRREFSAIGEEAFIPVADIDSEGLYWVESFQLEPFTLELGVRFDQQEIDTCDIDNDAFSFNGSLSWQPSTNSTFYAGLSRAERAPTVEESLSNIDPVSCTALAEDDRVLHVATARFELGDPDLDVETSNNLELGYRFYSDDLRAEFNVYHNRFDDYIFLLDTEVFESGLIASEQRQDDADFIGAEGKINWPFYQSGDNRWYVEVSADAVRARLDDDSNVPRIPPYRLGLTLGAESGALSGNIKVIGAHRQKKDVDTSFVTGGYTRVDAYLDYKAEFADTEWVIFAKAQNLTDEEIRDSTSFLKDFSVAFGRSFSLGIRAEF